MNFYNECENYLNYIKEQYGIVKNMIDIPFETNHSILSVLKATEQFINDKEEPSTVLYYIENVQEYLNRKVETKPFDIYIRNNRIDEFLQ